MTARRPPAFALWLVILAAPVALAFETGLRKLLFPADFEIVREFLQPYLTPVAWVLGIIAGLGGWIGLGLQRRLSARRLEKLPANASPEMRHSAVFAAFLLSVSLPQLPSVLSTICFTFGASIWPVLTGMVLCTLGVVAQALRVRPIADGG
ncbi:MAG: hypothetical protein AB7S26_25360 [Sandaracinaceae bacterium]